VQHSKIGRRKVEMGQTRSLQRCPLHDRSSTESGSPSAILLCRTSANSGCKHSQQDSPLFDHLIGEGEQRERRTDLAVKQVFRLNFRDDAARLSAVRSVGTGMPARRIGSAKLRYSCQ
jgi:hypothetical protein